MDVLALPRSTRNLQENSDVEALCGREVDARGEADEDGLQNCGDWWFCLIGGMRFARGGNNEVLGVSSNRSVNDGAERSMYPLLRSRFNCPLSYVVRLDGHSTHFDGGT